MKKVLVLGAGGFIGGHMVNRLQEKGNWVRAVDVKDHKHMSINCNDFILGDLTNYNVMKNVITLDGHPFDEIYNFAADMGGAEYVFTGDNDANIMLNSSMINTNLLKAQREINWSLGRSSTKIFYSSSACVYPEVDLTITGYSEDMAYPANPDSEYGWEKLFAERLYKAAENNYGIPTRVARLHNVYGPYGTFEGGKEKAPAAICRKVSEAHKGSQINIFGDGTQVRSFLYIDDCIDGIEMLMNSNFSLPINLGSEEAVSIGELADMVCEIADKKLLKNYVHGPTGVTFRNSDSSLAKQMIGWNPKTSLMDGLRKTYSWISSMTNNY